VPTERARDARFGYLAGEVDVPSKRKLCEGWISNVVARDEYAITHISFPETNVQDACFVRVRHRGDDYAEALEKPPRGCAFPEPDVRVRLAALAAELDSVAANPQRSNRFFDCTLADADKRAAAAHDARVLRRLAREPESYPYAAVIVPGHGLEAQGSCALSPFRPGSGCIALPPADHDALGGMMPRTRRAAALLHGQVAPIAIVSGGAVHSSLNESFAMLHLLSCARSDIGSFEAIPADRVLVEPCADHTHTNLRNSARWLAALGARAAYLITDDFLQAKYFQDESGFEFLGGSIDQRSLRDFGYLVGSWRQASIGLDSGFWFTPYRFWAEPRDGLGTLACASGP
jgi:hypothetical protein